MFSINIKVLRTLAFLLFVTPLIGLIGSLLIHNFLIHFNKFQTGHIIWPITGDISGEKSRYNCDEENEFCEYKNFKFEKKLFNCQSYNIIVDPVDKKNKKTINLKNYQERKKNFELILTTSNIKRKDCIKNSKYINIYNLSPFFFEKIFNLQHHPDYSLGTSKKINPIIYGETSISNIVKRFPIKFIFKPLMFVTCVLMIFYWLSFNKILNAISNEKKINPYFIFGILSSIFLFLHTLYLGTEFEIKFLNKLRRVFVVFFIFFEVFAQSLLLKNLYKIKNNLKKYCYTNIIFTKLIFIIFVIFCTIAILTIFIFFSLDSKFDYIVEWNYFIFLLFFYLLSSLMWKKTN